MDHEQIARQSVGQCGPGVHSLPPVCLHVKGVGHQRSSGEHGKDLRLHISCRGFWIAHFIQGYPMFDSVSETLEAHSRVAREVIVQQGLAVAGRNEASVALLQLKRGIPVK
jgi:hypothetical protein